MLVKLHGLAALLHRVCCCLAHVTLLLCRVVVVVVVDDDDVDVATDTPTWRARPQPAQPAQQLRVPISLSGRT